MRMRENLIGKSDNFLIIFNRYVTILQKLLLFKLDINLNKIQSFENFVYNFY